MVITIDNILFIGSFLLLISIVLGKTSHRFGVPTLLLFLGVGMLAGSEGLGGIPFDDPQLAQFIGVVCLNFILFSGGLDTQWKSVKPVLKPGLMLSTVGVVLTAVSLGGFVYVLTSFTLWESMLLGAIVSSTDAAAVFSILRSRKLGLKDHIRPTLELESGSNDPMAYVLTLVFLTLVENQDSDWTTIVPLFVKQMALGALLGWVFGRFMRFIINKIALNVEGLYPVLVIAMMFFAFSVTNGLGGNGFLAIYLAAVYLGNQEFMHKKTILKMYDGLAWLMQIVLFLTLGLLVFPSAIIPHLGLGLLISLFLILVARPMGVWLSLAGFHWPKRQVWYISWVGLRGAVPIVFATYPLLAGIDKAPMIFNLVFFIAVSSVVIQGTTLSIVARWLGVSVPEDEKPLSETEQIILELPKSSSREFSLGPEAWVVGKRIVDIHFPANAFIVMIQRKGIFLRPGGSTLLMAEDVLTVLADQPSDFEGVSDVLNKRK
jgi:potassium/hydrogen antiporter